MKYNVSIPLEIRLGEVKLPLTVTFVAEVIQLPGATATPIDENPPPADDGNPPPAGLV